MYDLAKPVLHARRVIHHVIHVASVLEAKAVSACARLFDRWARSTARQRFERIAIVMRLGAPISPREWSASLVLGLFGLVVPAAAMLLFDNVLAFGGGVEAAALLVAAIGLVVVEAGLRFARVTFADTTELHRESLRSGALLARLASTAFDPREEDGAPARVARLEAAAEQAELRAGRLRRAMLDMPFVVIALAALVWIGGWLALAPIVMIAGVIAQFATSSMALSEAARLRDAHDARSDDFVAECIANIAALKGAAMEPFMTRRMEQLLASGRDLDSRHFNASDRAEDLEPMLEAATVFAVTAIGGLVAAQGGISIGVLAACALLAGRIVAPIARLSASAQRAVALGAEGDVAFEAPDERVVRAETQVADLRVDAELMDGMERIVFEAPAGAMIAFAGRDGARLSAALRTIGGIDRPAEGRVRFAGVEMADYRAAHPGAVAMVSPHSELVTGTVRENLTMFGHGGPEAAALAACDILGLRPEIDRLPRKLDTMVGDGDADGLSASLAHRLAIARALAMTPRVLLLDEPQSQLDAAADRALIAALGALKGKMTIIIATSRPSYLELADQVFALDGRRVTPLSAFAPQKRAGAA